MFPACPSQAVNDCSHAAVKTFDAPADEQRGPENNERLITGVEKNFRKLRRISKVSSIGTGHQVRLRTPTKPAESHISRASVAGGNIDIATFTHIEPLTPLSARALFEQLK